MSSAPSTSSHPPPSGVLAQSSVHPTPIEFSPSSPVKEKITKQFAERNRSEVQVRAYDEDIARFFEFLDIPDDHLPSKLPKFNGQVSLDNFVKLANAMAKSMKELYFADKDLLVFKATGSRSHSGHVTFTDCRPDYTAAFLSDWGSNNSTLWPCIRLVGEKASKGESREEQGKHAMSYLHYLLLARPDLHVAQGVFTSKSDIMFLLGIAGVGIHTYSVGWRSNDINRLIYAFIYRLYDPSHFADSSYVKTVSNLKERIVTYNIQITEVNGAARNPITITDLRPIYASNPFGTRTHILTNPDSRVNINGKPLTVVKDQLCHVGARFSEQSILAQVHHPEKVPGVVEAVHHEVMKIPRDLCRSREKHRLGLRQIGKPFTTIPTVAQVLEVIFDILEVLQYLRFARNVLHRDISKGNVLYVEDNTPSTGSHSGDSIETVRLEVQPLCFIKYLLGESNDPKKTSVLLIDFNHAEHLKSESHLENERSAPIGTPAFMARSVQLGRAVLPHSDYLVIPEVPRSAICYETCHPDRIKKFPYRPREAYFISTEGTEPQYPQWRHELDHDTESVFWLLFYWLLRAQPENEQNEPIDASFWASFMGSAQARIGLFRSSLDGATHSMYRPLWPLLNKLASILKADRHWVESSDPRNDPGYMNEALQRLILQFILEHRNETFMHCRVGSQPRLPELIPGYLSSSSDTSRKRSLSEPTIPDGTKRLRDCHSGESD